MWVAGDQQVESSSLFYVALSFLAGNGSPCGFETFFSPPPTTHAKLTWTPEPTWPVPGLWGAKTQGFSVILILCLRPEDWIVAMRGSLEATGVPERQSSIDLPCQSWGPLGQSSTQAAY